MAPVAGIAFTVAGYLVVGSGIAVALGAMAAARWL